MAFFGPVFGFALIVLVVVFIHDAVKRNRKTRHEELMKMLDKGIDIPPEWWKTNAPGKGALLWGVILVGLGIGLQIMQGINLVADLTMGRLFHPHEAGDYFLGLIFLGVGIALLYYHKHRDRLEGIHPPPAREKPDSAQSQQ